MFRYQTFALIILVVFSILIAVPACQNPGGDTTPTPTPIPQPPTGDAVARANLTVVKLNVSASTARGPAVGNGMLAFDADNGQSLAWLKVGETTASEVPIPYGMTHDSQAFAFTGDYLVCRDRSSGGLFFYDTLANQSVAISAASIDMGGVGAANLWAVDDSYIATCNATTTTENGAGRQIKLIRINNVESLAITPFAFAPTDSPDAIDLDMENQMIAIRGGERFYVYDTTEPNTAPAQHYRPASSGGTGSSAIHLRGGLLTFFDDNDYFTVLDVTNGTFTQPARNPGRSDLPTALGSGNIAFFVAENTDDSIIDTSHYRALAGDAESLNELLDPQGSYLNGVDETAGRVGFGRSLGISDDGKYVFVAGDSADGVGDDERLYVSTSGGVFTAVADSADSLNAQQAAGITVGDSLAAFLIPADSNGVSVGYIELDGQ